MNFETIIRSLHQASCCCMSLEMSFMLLCELGNYYKRFCIEVCIEPCIAM